MSAAADRLTTETAAEYLRLALPLMSKQRVSTTPRNYAVWYTYVDRADLDEIEKRYGDARRTEISTEEIEGGFDIEELITEEMMVVTADGPLVTTLFPCEELMVANEY